jgi:hypothetical protein
MLRWRMLRCTFPRLIIRLAYSEAFRVVQEDVLASTWSGLLRQSKGVMDCIVRGVMSCVCGLCSYVSTGRDGLESQADLDNAIHVNGHLHPLRSKMG